MSAPVQASPESLEGHPAVDIISSAAAVVVQDREVVGLDPFLVDALASAGRAGVQLQLVTPPDSRLTLPLAELLRGSGGLWVVRRADGRSTEGLTGRVLEWDGSCFTDPPSGAAVDDAWTTPRPVKRGSLAVDLTVVHPAARELQLGEAVELCCSVLADGEATGWAVAEPVSQRWERAALTTFCRGRAPAPTTLVVIGGSAGRLALGTLHVTRTTSGVHERLRLQVGAGEEVDYDRLDRLAERLAGLAVPPRIALLGLQPGRDDGTVEAAAVGATVPYGLLLGPSVVAEVGRETALSSPAPAAKLVGSWEAQSLWAHLLPDSGTANPGEVLGQVLRHLGVTFDQPG